MRVWCGPSHAFKYFTHKRRRTKGEKKIELSVSNPEHVYSSFSCDSPSIKPNCRRTSVWKSLWFFFSISLFLFLFLKVLIYACCADKKMKIPRGGLKHSYSLRPFPKTILRGIISKSEIPTRICNTERKREREAKSWNSYMFHHRIAM